MSPKSAGLAKKWGYTDAKVYIEGVPGWKKAGHYTTATLEHVKAGNIVLVDLRSPGAVKAGHIPRAVGIPSANLSAAQNEFPAYKGASVVFVSDSRNDLTMAVKTARKWGYKNSTVFLGGIDAWQAKGYSLEKGPAATQITYVRKLGPDEISIKDFKNAVESGSAVIVDVRTAEEYARGHFKGAVHIPVDDIASRYSELPADKNILVHCKTGVRAEMGLNILKDKGYNVKFLKAKPEFNPDGTYKILE
jgi:rhodanese-related sulfurtransferase